MHNLKFKQLLVLSDTNKLANQFIFNEKRNLITANDNSVGKSTLVKLLLWGMGCDPTFDSKWTSQDCKVIVEFCIGEQTYIVRRYKDQIAIKEGYNRFTSFPKITGNYSRVLANILKFKALLPNRKSEVLETPPPAYYFLPFYIDQKRSWANAWDNFEGLGQYHDWKSTIIKYHVGLLTDEYFDLKYQILEKRNQLKSVVQQIEKYEIAIDVVNEYIPEITYATTNEEEFQKLTDEIRIELRQLQIDQENLLNTFTQLQADKSHLEQQRLISEKIIYELESDYQFSVENINDEKIECPLCGTIHENSILNRSSILVDKKQSENQLESIVSELNKVCQKIEKIQISLNKARNRITEINAKYIIVDEEKVISFNQIIEQIAGSAIKNNTIAAKSERIIEKNILDKDIRKENKNLKNLIPEEHTTTVNNSFIGILNNYVETFGAESINFSEIKSPLDYNKIIREGGAAEGTRAILAYYLTIFSMVLKFSSEIASPLIIDTPNQQEQSDFNYSKIVDFLANEIPQTTQVFLCAMNNQHLETFKQNAKVFVLDESKLLIPQKYQEVKDIFMSMLHE